MNEEEEVWSEDVELLEYIEGTDGEEKSPTVRNQVINATENAPRYISDEKFGFIGRFFRMHINFYVHIYDIGYIHIILYLDLFLYDLFLGKLFYKESFNKKNKNKILILRRGYRKLERKSAMKSLKNELSGLRIENSFSTKRGE